MLLETAPATGGASDETPPGSRFGELLVEEGLVTPDQLAEALRVQSTLDTYIPIGRVLMMLPHADPAHHDAGPSPQARAPG